MCCVCELLTSTIAHAHVSTVLRAIHEEHERSHHTADYDEDKCERNDVLVVVTKVCALVDLRKYDVSGRRRGQLSFTAYRPRGISCDRNVLIYSNLQYTLA